MEIAITHRRPGMGRYPLTPQAFHAIVALRGLIADAKVLMLALEQGTAQLLQGVPIKTCAGCGASFHAAHPRQRYHTEACRAAARKRRRKAAYAERTHPEEAEE
jgi:hypothetical protein